MRESCGNRYHSGRKYVKDRNKIIVGRWFMLSHWEITHSSSGLFKLTRYICEMLSDLKFQIIKQARKPKTSLSPSKTTQLYICIQGCEESQMDKPLRTIYYLANAYSHIPHYEKLVQNSCAKHTRFESLKIKLKSVELKKFTKRNNSSQMFE